MDFIFKVQKKIIWEALNKFADSKPVHLLPFKKQLKQQSLIYSKTHIYAQITPKE